MGCGYGFVDTLYIHVVCVCVWVCVCVCVCVKRLNRRKTSIAISVAGGAGGTDETGTSKDTPQMPVISMGTLIDDTDVPAF